MEKKLFEAFDALKMSDECENKIRTSLSKPRSVFHRVRLGALAAAACLLLVLLVFTNETAVQALETIGEDIRTAIVSLFYPDATVKEQYQFENGDFVAERGTNADGQDYNHVRYATGSVPSWLKVEDDGLYFTGNGEYIEISSLISDEVPFTYVLTDSDGIRHYIIVGGTYGTGENALDDVGWTVFLQKESSDMLSGWIGGYGKGDGPWYNNGRDILGIIYWGR